MNFVGHTITIFIVCGMLAYLGLLPFSVWVIFPAVLISAIIDSDWKMPFVKHRGATHTIWFIMLVAFVAYIITRSTEYGTLITAGVLIGGLLHLGVDSL